MQLVLMLLAIFSHRHYGGAYKFNAISLTLVGMLTYVFGLFAIFSRHGERYFYYIILLGINVLFDVNLLILAKSADYPGPTKCIAKSKLIADVIMTIFGVLYYKKMRSSDEVQV